MVRRLNLGRSMVVLVFLVLVSLVVLVGIRFVESGTIASRVTTEFEPLTGPSLAVLALQPPRIMLFDPGTLSLQREIRLRSTSIDIGARGDLLVTAQCGGPGAASDTAVAVVEPAKGSVNYVETGWLDAEQVRPWGAAPDSRWLVVHGEVNGTASAGAIVDGSLLSAGDTALPAGILCAENVGGRMWATGLTGGESGEALTEALYVGDDAGWRLLGSVESASAILEMGPDVVLVESRGDSRARISVRDAAGMVVRSGEIDGFEYGIGSACVVRPGLLAIADSDWRDPDRLGERVVLVDTTSLRIARTIGDTSGPVALCAEVGMLFVACQGSGEIVRIDPDSGAVIATTDAAFSLADVVDMTVWRDGV